MKLWQFVGGVAIACAACGGSIAPTATDAASVAVMDAGADRPAAVDAAGADAATKAPTWSTIYGQMLVNAGYASNCMGAKCHDPGTEKGIDLSTQEKGWSTIQHRLSPGNPDASELIQVLKNGSMPDGRAKMPAADIDQISAWVAAGAQDN